MTIAVDPGLLARALEPPIRLGSGLLQATLAALDAPWALVTQPEPLALLAPSLVERADAVLLVDSLAAVDLDGLVAALPAGLRTVVGFGGGMAVDAAKWAAGRRGARLVLAPSIVSVDAVVTNTVAVRRGGGIAYEGFVVADDIVLDPDVVRAAPARLNRAGVGDLVSIHTGLFDWRLGAAAGTVAFDEEVASAAASVLEGIERLAPEVHDVTDLGMEGLLRAYAEVNALCLRVGHSGPEEGSEHYLGYRLEALTGRSFVHGELIGLATVLMATVQRNEPRRPARLLDRCGVAWRPGEQALSDEVLVEALAGLPAFVREQMLPHSVADEAELSGAAAAGLVEEALALAGGG